LDPAHRWIKETGQIHLAWPVGGLIFFFSSGEGLL
jgi:hypothetical protein